MISSPPELSAQLMRIDALKQQLDALRPTLTPDVLARVFQKFRLDWNYHSNSIEGNSLTFGETVAFLMEGVTAKGKPLKDHLDLRGHNAAIDFLLALVKDERGISESEIRELHRLILVEPYTVPAETATGLPTTKTIQLGPYKTMPNHVRTATGAVHYYAKPEDTPAKMQELMTWYRAQHATLHPLVLAAEFHHRFVAIHPFDDGNGRMTRLLTNLILMQAGFPPIVIKTAEKSAYYGVLSQADAGEKGPLLAFFAEHLLHALDLYLRGAQGGDISETSDLDKEIALLKASFDRADQVILQQDAATVQAVVWASVVPLFEHLHAKCSALAELFGEYVTTILTVRVGATQPAYLFSNKTDSFIPADLREALQQDLLNPDDLREIVLEFRLNFFKKTTKPFDVANAVRFEFNRYNYAVKWSNRQPDLSKLYGTALTDSETDQVTAELVRYLIAAIKQLTASAA